MLATVILSTEIKLILSAVIVLGTILFLLLVYGKPLSLFSWLTTLAKSNEEKPIELRGADQPAPKGTAEYLRDLSLAAPKAPPEFILEKAMAGATLSKVRQDWIEELLKRQEGAVK